jgi:hypothetical protein
MRGIGYPRKQAWAALTIGRKCTITLFHVVRGMRWNRYGPEHASNKCEFQKCGSVEAWTTRLAAAAGV